MQILILSFPDPNSEKKDDLHSDKGEESDCSGDSETKGRTSHFTDTAREDGLAGRRGAKGSRTHGRRSSGRGNDGSGSRGDGSDVDGGARRSTPLGDDGCRRRASRRGGLGDTNVVDALAFPRVSSRTILIFVAADRDSGCLGLGARGDGGDGSHILELDAHVVHADGVVGISSGTI